MALTPPPDQGMTPLSLRCLFLGRLNVLLLRAYLFSFVLNNHQFKAAPLDEKKINQEEKEEQEEEEKSYLSDL